MELSRLESGPPGLESGIILDGMGTDQGTGLERKVTTAGIDGHRDGRGLLQPGLGVLGAGGLDPSCQDQWAKGCRCGPLLPGFRVPGLEGKGPWSRSVVTGLETAGKGTRG